jgi:SAM-dependent methyltransferase
MSETLRIRPLIEKYLTGAKVILDIGCGTEEKITPDAIGIDIRHGLANIVLDNPGDIYHLEKCGRLWKQTNYERADVVFSSHTLEHIADWKSALLSWTKLLKPDGVLILYLPDERRYDNFTNAEHLQSWNYIEWKGNCPWGDIVESGEHFTDGAYSFYVVLKRQESQVLDWQELAGYFEEHNRIEYEYLVDQVPDGSTIMEVGVFRGKSICSLAPVIKRKKLQVIAVDLFDVVDYAEDDVMKKRFGMFSDFTRNIKYFGLQHYVTAVKGDSSMIKVNCSLIFIDADHSYKAVRADIDNLWPLVEPGGILCGHDYGEYCPGVMKAVDESFPEKRVKAFIWSVKK